MVFARCSTDPISTPPMVSLLADLDLSIFGAILGSSQMSESQKFHTKSPGLTLRVFVTWGFAAAQSVPGSAVAGSAGGSRLIVFDNENGMRQNL